MGSLQKVGEKLSKGRNMEMIAARERITEGVRLYVRRVAATYSHVPLVWCTPTGWWLEQQSFAPTILGYSVPPAAIFLRLAAFWQWVIKRKRRIGPRHRELRLERVLLHKSSAADN